MPNQPQFLMAALGLLFGSLATPSPGSAEVIELRPLVSKLERPVGLVHAGDGSNRLFVVEQRGVVSIVSDGKLRRRPFLDLSDQIDCCGGRGLLALAFHPRYETNGTFYVYYVDASSQAVLSRFEVSAASPNRARSGSEVEMLRFDGLFNGHWGGGLAFGADGFLYLSTGDGSDGGDPENNAQDLTSLQGKVLRLDVDAGPGAVPASNPFVADPQARDEIWALGLRNPWRMSFDRATGDLFIADVGQGHREEVNLETAGSGGGNNYGWRRMEGTRCFEPATDCVEEGLVLPILEYGHDLGCSITGGYRYRGRSAPTLEGHYIFSDFCSGTLWGAEPNRDGAWVSRVLATSGRRIVTFGEDEDGELYAVDFAGEVLELRSREIFADGFESGRLERWKRRGGVKVVAPGLQGSGYALSVSAESDGSSRVLSRSPDRATSLKVGLSLNGRDLDLASGEADLLTLSDANAVHARIALERVSKNRLRAVLYALDVGGRERRIGEVRFGRKKTVRLDLSWRAATSPGSADGSATLSKNSRKKVGGEGFETGARVVTALALGLPHGAPPGSRGRVLLDGVSVTR